ncbi:MAG: hypothetical protein IT518_09765 [Burkholderiales bacterium]|nr:hypothetical protein [Burkholderiales bacterium]
MAIRFGETHGRAVLTWDEVELMRQCHDAGMPVLRIAKKFERPRRTVRNVLDYNTWTEAPPRRSAAARG